MIFVSLTDLWPTFERESPTAGAPVHRGLPDIPSVNSSQQQHKRVIFPGDLVDLEEKSQSSLYIFVYVEWMES